MNIDLSSSSQDARLLIDHSSDNLRSGEGSLVVLNDGRLLLLYSEFIGGGADESEGYIACIISEDDGLTWSASQPLFRAPIGALNTMGVSVLRLTDGRLGCVFGLKYSRNHLIPQWTVSSDEGVTWSSPAPICLEKEYFVINNDRLIQDSTGNLILPYALHQCISGDEQYEHWDPAWNATCGLFYSKDGGRTWVRSSQSVTHTPEVFVQPKYLTSEPAPGVLYQLENRLGSFQEPGVQELNDGTLMLYIRSSYATFRCFSDGLEEPWSVCEAIDGINTCLSPQTVRRLPALSKLIMFYNERGQAAFGAPGFHERTPLSVAVSEDEGRSWQHWRDIEGTDKNFCYVSALCHRGTWYLTYYESAEKINGHGKIVRRNLASLKFRKITNSFFTELG